MRFDAPSPAAAIAPAIACAALALAPSARADHYNLARVTLSPAAPGGGGPADVFETRPGPAHAAASTTGGLDSAGTGSADVDYGRVSFTGTASGSLTASLLSFTRDIITITAPGVADGTPGTLTYSISLAGNWTVPSGVSSVRWRLVSDLGSGGHDINRTGLLESPELGGLVSGDAPGTYSATIAFTYGQPLQLSLQVTAVATAAPGQSGAGAATIDMPHALLWLGMKDLTAAGNPITQFLAASESGADWSVPAGNGNDCPADFNADGFLDFFDADSFIACFEGETCPPGKSADFNADGFVDFFDADSFLAAFEAGC